MSSFVPSTESIGALTHTHPFNPPKQLCNATKEELLTSKKFELDILDKCPSCSVEVGWHPTGTVTVASSSSNTFARKRKREDEEYEEQKIEKLKMELEELRNKQRQLLAEAEATSNADMKGALKGQAQEVNLQARSVREEIDDRRKRLKSSLAGLTSAPYFTHVDVDSERWFKKLILISEELKKCGESPIVAEVPNADEVFGSPSESESISMPLQLRAAIRFSAFRIVSPSDRTSLCAPADDRVGNDTVDWLVKAKEPKLQWSLLQLMRAAAGNQAGISWEVEDLSQQQPREDLRGFVNGVKVTTAEIKKKLSQSVHANAEGLGQIGRYGARDCKQGHYLAILSTLSYCLFVRIIYKNENEVERYAVYPPISQIHREGLLLENVLEEVDQYATHLQTILPVATPPAFVHMVRFIDRVCLLQNVPITLPVIYLRTPGSVLERKWELSHPRVLHQTLRSLIIGVDHFDPAAAAGSQVVIKIASEANVSREETIHHIVDGKVLAVRHAIGRVSIEGGCQKLVGLVLDPLGDPLTTLLISQVDSFLKDGAAVLKDLHAAGVWHRDVKPGNFLFFQGRLLLNDFDLSASHADPSNVGFQSGTSRFSSPYLSDQHTYCARDDFISLLLTAVELVQKDTMDMVNEDAIKKKQLLADLRDGRRVITARLQELATEWMEM